MATLAAFLFLLCSLRSVFSYSSEPEDPSKWISIGAICIAIRDEHLDVHEWVSYHSQLLGVKKIYMFDFRSKPPLNATIQPFIDNGTVTYSFHDEIPKKFKYDQDFAFK